MAEQVRIALVGKAGSGKDHFASYVASKMLTLRVAYADQLKADVGQMVFRTNQRPIQAVNEAKHLPQMRALLQNYGELMVQLRGETYWAERCKGQYYAHWLHADEWLKTSIAEVAVPEAIIITDCRKLPEAEHARADGFHIVRITRTDGHVPAGMTAEAMQHRSETEMDQIIADYYLYNQGDASYEKSIDDLLTMLRGQ